MRNIKIFLQFTKYKTLLVLFFAFPCFAQQTTDAKKIDSLLQLVKVCKVDTTKVNLYFNITSLYFRNDFTQTKPYNNIIYQLSKKNNFEVGHAHFYYNSALFNIFCGNHSKGLDLAIKSSKIYKKYNRIDNFISSQYLVAQSLSKLGKKDAAIVIAQEQLKINHNGKYLNSLAKINYLLGCVYRDELNFSKAVFFIENARKLFVKSKNISGEYSCINEIIITLMQTNQFSKAVKMSDEAVQYILKNTFAMHKNEIFITLVANNSKIHAENGEFVLARKLTNQAIVILKNSNNKVITAMLYNQLATIDTKLNNLTSAENAAKIAKATSLDSNTQETALSMLTQIYLSRKDFVSAKTQGELLLKQLKKSQQWQYNYDVYNQLSDAESGLKQYKIALNYKHKYLILHDSFTKLFNQKDIKELQTRYEVEEKIRRMKNYENEKQKTYTTIKSQYIFLVVALLVIILIVIMLRLINIKNQKLSESEKKLQKSVEFKNIMLKETHHRIKNNHQMVISLLIIQAKKSNFTTIDQFIEKAQHRINAISLVHENLYQSEYFDEGSIKEYIVKLVSHIESNLDSTLQKVSFMTNIAGIMLNIQTMIACGLIINELVTNSLKYAFENIANPLIEISFTELPEYFVLIISDNGKGMLRQNQKKTMGFELVRMLTLQLNGDCKFKNSNGLSVIITFPKTNKYEI